MSRPSTAKRRLTDAAMEMMWENSYGATSVDAICERADVRKGSFYYFFKSKSDLTAAAFDADWRKTREKLDRIFSPTVPPLERFRHYFDSCYADLTALKAECGAVLGCPMTTLGCEISTQDSVLRDKVQEILDEKLRYFESAIRDADAQGLIHAPNAKEKADTLFAFFEGTLTQARIHNDVEPLRQLYSRTLDLLGAGEQTFSRA